MANESLEEAIVTQQFNLSDWALKHQTVVLYLMLMLVVSGMFAYTKLGQSEDPPFTFKVMLIRTAWPGASAVEVEQFWMYPWWFGCIKEFATRYS